MIYPRTGKRYYSATICGADGDEKVEFPALCGENLSLLVNVCISQGFPVLVDAPVFNVKDESAEETETGK